MTIDAPASHLFIAADIMQTLQKEEGRPLDAINTGFQQYLEQCTPEERTQAKKDPSKLFLSLQQKMNLEWMIRKTALDQQANTCAVTFDMQFSRLRTMLASNLFPLTHLQTIAALYKLTLEIEPKSGHSSPRTPFDEKDPRDATPENRDSPTASQLNLPELSPTSPSLLCKYDTTSAAPAEALDKEDQTELQKMLEQDEV